MNPSTQEIDVPKPLLFGLGMLTITPGIQALIEQQDLDIVSLIARHQTGDWGCVCAEDALENQRSLQHGFRLLSAYEVTLDAELAASIKVWIITEADRSVTTVLLPSEY